MVAGYFAQRAAREHQTTVLRVLKEIGVEAVTQNITLDKAVKAKYKLPHKGCGKVSKFLIWAGVPKKVVDAFYSVVERKASSNIQIIHRSLGYDGEIMRKQSDSIHFTSCMHPSKSYHKEYIEEDIQAFNLGVVGMVVLGDINEKNKLFCRAKYRFLFNPETLKIGDYESQAVAILLDRNYPDYNASAYFVKALNEQYPHLPVLTGKGRVTPENRSYNRFSPKSLVFETQDALITLKNIARTTYELTGFPDNALGYQDTLDDDGDVNIKLLDKLNVVDPHKIVSKFQKEAYVRKKFHFARAEHFTTTKPIKGGISYIYELNADTNKRLDIIEKGDEQAYIHFTGYEEIGYAQSYRVRRYKQSILYDRLFHTRMLDTCSNFLKYFPDLNGSESDFKEGYYHLRDDFKRIYLTLLSLTAFLKNERRTRRLFDWLPSFIPRWEQKLIKYHPSLKQRIEELSMVPLPTSLRLYLNAFVAKDCKKFFNLDDNDTYHWVSEMIKRIEKENPNYTYDAFLSQDKQSGIVVVYNKSSRSLADAVLVSAFYQNDKQRDAIKEALSVYYLYSDFANLFCEELSESTAYYFNRRTN